MGLINYLGNSKVIKRICQLLNVTDVQDGEGHSLVDENGIAVVTGGGGGSSTLAGLSDVNVTGVQTGDVLSFNGTNWEDKTLATVAASGAYNDLLNKPTALSAFTNDTGFITNSVNNLTNYYLKSETYTKSEVNNLIGQITTISILVVQVLPQTGETNIIYLVPKSASETSNAYDEYIYVSGAWELIGDTTVDLSNYYTKSEVDALIPDELADLTDDATHRLVTDTEKTAWNGKSVVSANPQSTTGTLSGLEIDGVSYSIPSGGGNVQPDWNETDSTADDYIKNKPSLATVATSGSYNDLSNKPTIPTNSSQIKQNNNITVENALKTNHYAVNASTSQYSTLLDYVINVIVPLNLHIISFSAGGFNDLPRNDWGYDVTVIRSAGIYVKAEMQLSNGTIYTRGINAQNQWVGNWELLAKLLDVYPVGSIYMSVNNTNPSTLFGGTWVAWGSGRVPVGVNTNDSNFNTVEKTGGSSTVTLTTDQLPKHSHGLFGGNYNYTSPSAVASAPCLGGVDGYSANLKSNETGGGKAHNNLQPYITCYMWKRTA